MTRSQKLHRDWLRNLATRISNSIVAKFLSPSLWCQATEGNAFLCMFGTMRDKQYEWIWMCYLYDAKWIERTNEEERKKWRNDKRMNECMFGTLIGIFFGCKKMRT